MESKRGKAERRRKRRRKRWRRRGEKKNRGNDESASDGVGSTAEGWGEKGGRLRRADGDGGRGGETEKEGDDDDDDDTERTSFESQVKRPLAGVRARDLPAGRQAGKQTGR